MTSKEWFIAAILTLITIISWVTFDIIHARSAVQIPQTIQEVIEPINPNFNTQILESTP